jgi:hypothetical protein
MEAFFWAAPTFAALTLPSLWLWFFPPRLQKDKCAHRVYAGSSKRVLARGWGVGRCIATASAISWIRCGSHVKKVANMSVCPFVFLNLFPAVFVEILVPWPYSAQRLPLIFH